MVFKKSKIAKELLQMQATDLSTRDQLFREEPHFHGYHHRMERVHLENANRLKEIIDLIGYPTQKKVGKKANYAAWMIIQHAIGLPDFQRGCLKLIEQAVHSGEADPKQFAYLSDRIAFFERRPQTYGTQFDWDEEGKMSPWLIADRLRVNELRKDLGLNTIEEQTELHRKGVSPDHIPKDWAKRMSEMGLWLKKVGWVH